MTNKITFEKASSLYKEIIFSWLAKPHVQEFWDNTQAHKDDILNFMSDRKEPSNYCDGKYIYWIALDSGKPYAMLMTIANTLKDELSDRLLELLSKTGHTYGLDYMIGCAEHIGKGYGAKTLIEFIDFFRESFDKKADTFMIDPAADNPRAKRVYEKAGFKHIADFVMGGDCSDSGKPHHLLIKKFEPAVTLEPITVDNYHIIQNMAQLYVYDASRELGFSISGDGLYNPKSYRCYCEDSDKVAYVIKVYDEIAGFALINEKGLEKHTDWKIDQFFILAKFQRSGIGKVTTEKIWQLHPGKWEVSVIPENISALKFWENTISKFTDNVFEKETKLIDSDKDQPKRIIFSFDSEISDLEQKLNITLELAKKLIVTQFPEYIGLNVIEVEQQGHDNRTYRIGDDVLIRMPIAESYALKVPKEQELLPKLAKYLSVAIPAPIKMGKPSKDYPYVFSIYKWLDGRSANHITLDEQSLENLAFELGKFLKELQAIKTNIYMRSIMTRMMRIII
jgi:predicted acetyltransferase/RimJ/RimL family protein N-acetyltransferase